MTSLQTVGVLAHPKRHQTVPVAENIVENLRGHGIITWTYAVWQADEIVDDVRDADLVVAIGGDGAMLHAARVCAPYDVPVLGVNTGRLGFLTEIARADQWAQHVERLLAGDYWIETRMMIDIHIIRHGTRIAHETALNEAVISGNGAGSMIRLDMYIDGDWATTYNADNLIVATPTGSTAYALAVGGPILPPDLLNILIIPTAPHLSMDRPLVLSEGAQVAVVPSPDNREAVLVKVDNTLLSHLQADDIVSIRASDHSARFIRLRERNYFYRSLLDKLEPRVNRTAPRNAEALNKIREQLKGAIPPGA